MSRKLRLKTRVINKSSKYANRKTTSLIFFGFFLKKPICYNKRRRTTAKPANRLFRNNYRIKDARNEITQGVDVDNGCMLGGNPLLALLNNARKTFVKFYNS